MSKQQAVKTFFYGLLVFLCSGTLAASEPEKSASLEEQVQGLWLYTALITSDGKDLPLKGIFLFKDDVFIQYAAYDSEPLKDQGSMAHAGPYSTGDEFVHLVAEQTLSTAPLKDQPMNSRGLTEHDVTVSRSGKDLTLIFSKGTGTVQKFERVGPGTGEVYKLENGMLALVDGYFILVNGNGSGIDSGYATYDKDQDSLKLNIKRWTKADPSAASNLYDTSMKATFDGQSLNLDDGRSFRVIP
jgi:hypothetical protein